MLAVKGFFQSHCKRIALGIINRHANPGGRLKKSPMPARNDDEQRDDDPFARPALHAKELRAGSPKASAARIYPGRTIADPCRISSNSFCHFMGRQTAYPLKQRLQILR